MIKNHQSPIEKESHITKEIIQKTMSEIDMKEVINMNIGRRDVIGIIINLIIRINGREAQGSQLQGKMWEATVAMWVAIITKLTTETTLIPTKTSPYIDTIQIITVGYKLKILLQQIYRHIIRVLTQVENMIRVDLCITNQYIGESMRGIRMRGSMRKGMAARIVGESLIIEVKMLIGAALIITVGRPILTKATITKMAKFDPKSSVF